MKKSDLSVIVSKNLAYFMGQSRHLKNANALAVKAKVSANSVRNLLDPKKRTVTANKPVGAPQLDTLQKLAEALQIDVWQLLHPAVEDALRQEELYRLIKKNFNELN